MALFVLLQEACTPSKELSSTILSIKNNYEYSKESTNKHKFSAA